MKLSTVRNQYIAFTFSLRGVGEKATLIWLRDHFPELGIKSSTEQSHSLDLNILQHRQYVKEYDNLNLFGYRDSGDNMISGLIKVA